MRLSRPVVAATLAFTFLACAKSGERATRPVEVTFSISRPAGVPFDVIAIQGENADHRFPCDAPPCFTSPYMFVLENTIQPVRGIFHNTDPDSPMTVDLSFGTDIVNSQEIPPGGCCTVTPGGECSVDPQPCEQPVDKPMQREIRFDIYSLSEVKHIAFSATIGDQTATNITLCTLGADLCRTPATFFIEDAQDTVSGVFSKLSDQDQDARFRVDMLIDGTLRQSGADKGSVILSQDL